MTDELIIVYEDSELLIVDKPAGLLMHPSWLDRKEKDTLASRVKAYAKGSKVDFKVHTVHRLDRPTSGLVVIAKTESAARDLSKQFLENTVEKHYWAITRGFAPEQVVIDHALIEEQDKIADKFAQQSKQAQPAVTEILRLGIAELALPVGKYPKSRYSWLECIPKTGRKHQIRRHLKHLRYPIIGDTRHGCRHHSQAAAAHLSINSLALRAVRITFIHPSTKQSLSVYADITPQWQAWLNHFGWL